MNDSDVTAAPPDAQALLARLHSRAVAVVAADDVDALEAAWIAPLARALAAGVIARLEIVIDRWRRHGRAARVAEVLARRARARGVGCMLSRTIRRRAAGDGDALAGDLHPLLRRLYAARGVRRRERSRSRPESARSRSASSAASPRPSSCCARTSSSAGASSSIGDFDADGATSTALVVRQLTRLGFASVDFLVPNRFQYGYGLTPEIVRLAAQSRAGAHHHRRQRHLQSRGRRRGARARHRDADHRSSSRAGDRCRPRQRIVNPNAPGESFPSKALAGVGVAFYLMAALTREMQARGLMRDRAARGGSARPGGARHGRGSRAARSQQPRARASGAAAHSRRPLLRGHSRAAGSGEPRRRRNASPPISAIRSARA